MPRLSRQRLLLLTILLTILPTTLALAQSTPPLAPSSETAGQTVNALIDNLQATGQRLLQLPLFITLGGLAGLAIIPALLIARFARRRARLATLLRYSLAILLAIAAVLTIDQRIAGVASDLAALREKSSADTLHLLKSIAKWDTTRTTPLIDAAAAEKQLATTFHGVSLQPMIYDDAADFVQVKIDNPLAAAYIVIADLRTASLQIKVGAALDHKSLTTDFARKTDCTLAINGEAGESPSLDALLGQWRGNLITDGNIILREDARLPRPFLAFDRANRASFRSASAADRNLPSDSTNIIWGRWDALVAGQLPPATTLDRQPRTAMAISKDGSRLFLMVVDGRQPRYSNGFTRTEVGAFLNAFGAWDAMLCDEGGSSCLYLRQLGGICNSPSDGQERPTYTHFGLALHAGG